VILIPVYGVVVEMALSDAVILLSAASASGKRLAI
jgi:hypothetical protein